MPTPEETADRLLAAQRALAEAEAAHAQAKADAPPRNFEEILHDFMAAIVMRFGHHPELAALLTEFDAWIQGHKPPSAGATGATGPAA